MTRGVVRDSRWQIAISERPYHNEIKAFCFSFPLI
jgi:hypothetical protein